MLIKFIKNNTAAKIALLLATVVLFASCNKDLAEPTPIIYPDANAVNTTLGEAISSEASYSFYKAAATRVGALLMLSDTTNRFTLLLPTNNAFIASGIPSEAVIGALPIATVGAIVQYSILPGQQYLASEVTSDFPNVQLPTSLTIGVLPGTTVPLKMSVFLSKRDNGFWANTIPVLKPDNKFKNGVIHEVAGIVAPPSQLLKAAIYSNPDLTYFKAAIARADSGATGLNKLDFLLGYGVTNMTILAPNDDAFKTLIFGSIFGYLTGQGMDPATAAATATALSASPTVFENPALFSVLTAATVKGILAYHFLATPNTKGAYQPNIRAFSNNFSTTPAFYKTLVNAGVAIHPGIMAQATFTGPFVSSLQFTGMGTFPPGGAPFSGAAATAVSKDNHAVNGVFHVIDKVLLPQ